MRVGLNNDDGKKRMTIFKPKMTIKRMITLE
jgi:hypothetical protein